MALVRKFQEAGKVEEPKKVLVYENVGTYDADKLASSLTQSLESYANSLGLRAKDRQDFLKFGASMITAIKDGNVTKNTDGSFSINGEYGLNNTFSNIDIATKYANGEVGYGASPYQGEYQESHGIFTTRDTENFRHQNHILGLVGQWVNTALRKATTIESEATPTKADPANPFSFDKYFAEKEYGGSTKNKSIWQELYPTESERLARISAVLQGLSDDDFNKWSAANPSLGTGPQIKENINKLIGFIDSGDILNAKKESLRLGIPLNTYLPVPDQGNEGGGEEEEDEFVKAARAYFKQKKVVPTEEDVQELAGILRVNNTSEVEQVINDQRKVQLEKDWTAETKRLADAFKEYDSLAEETVFDTEDGQNPQAVQRALNNSLAWLNKALQHYNKGDQLNINNLTAQVDAFIDSYNSNYWSPEYKAYIYQILTKGAYKNWVLIKPASTDQSSIIFNPKTLKYRIVHNTQLEESAQYATLRNEFFKSQGVILKQGGMIPKMQGGDSINFIPLYLQNVNPSAKVAKAKKDEEARQQQIAEEQEKANRHPMYNSNVKDEEDEQGDFEIHDEDILRFLGLIGDIVSLAGGGWDVAGSFGSVGANLIADLVDEDVKGAWPIAKNALINTGLSIAGFIPTLGSIRLGRNLKRIAGTVPKIIAGVTTAMGVTDADVYLESFNNMLNGRWDTQDIQRMAQLGELILSYALAKGKGWKGERFGGVRQKRRSNQLEAFESGIDPNRPYTVEHKEQPFRITNDEFDNVMQANDGNAAIVDLQRKHGIPEEKIQEAWVRQDYYPNNPYGDDHHSYILNEKGKPAVVYPPRAAIFFDKFKIPEFKLPSLTRVKSEPTHKPVVGQPQKKQNGGVFEFAKEFAEQFRSGGILIPKGDKGFKIGDEYFDSQEAAEWYKKAHNLTDNITSADYGFDDWFYDDLLKAWEEAKTTGMFTPGQGVGTIASNPKQKQMAETMQTEAIYKEFTDYIKNAIASGNLNPQQKAYLEKLQQYVLAQNPQGSAIYFKNGVLDPSKAAYYERMRTDSKRGWHHFTPTKRTKDQKVYLNGVEVTDAAKKAELLKTNPLKQYTQSNKKGTTTHLFYEDGSAKTGTDDSNGKPGNNGTDGKKEIITVAGEQAPDKYRYGARPDWGYLTEFTKLGILNAGNVKSTKQKMKYFKPKKEYYHVNKEQEGAQEVLDVQENKAAQGNSLVNQMQYTDPSLIAANQTQQQHNNTQGALQAAITDKQAQSQNRQIRQDKIERANLYNLQASDYNYGQEAEKSESDALDKAVLSQRNYDNVGQGLGLISHGLFSQAADIRRFAQEREMQNQATRRWLALSEYEAKKRAFIPGSGTYETDIENLTRDTNRKLDLIDSPQPMRDIIGRRIIYTTDIFKDRRPSLALSRKGGRLIKENPYILNGAKDYNKMKMQSLREFYKSVRATKRKSKS